MEARATREICKVDNFLTMEVQWHLQRKINLKMTNNKKEEHEKRKSIRMDYTI